MTPAGWKANLADLLQSMAAAPAAGSGAGATASLQHLVDRWSGELYLPDAPLFRRQFSAAEQGRLKKFDAFLRARRDAVAGAGPTGDEGAGSAAREIAAEASHVLADLGWKRRP